MSFYQKATAFGLKFTSQSKLFKFGFNFSPMYRRSTARIKHVSEDLLHVDIKLPISWKNRNYMNSIFGGSMFSATDPISMIQLVYILGSDYIVWDRSAEIVFKKPAKEDLYADFDFNKAEVDQIIKDVEQKNEIDIQKKIFLTNRSKDTVYAEITKTLFIADKTYFKEKKKKRNRN
ncbi:MAG: DUF4442 domain-containing protein [Bacteroidota bacterium]